MIFINSPIFCRPWQNQVLIYKKKHSNSFINLSVHLIIDPLWAYIYGAAKPKRLYMVLLVIKWTMLHILNLKGHQYCIIGLKVTAIFLKGLILPISGVASVRVCACSLRHSLVFKFPNKGLGQIIYNQWTATLELIKTWQSWKWFKAGKLLDWTKSKGWVLWGA